MGFPSGSDGRVYLQCRSPDSISGLGRFPWRRGHGNPLQYSSLENPIDRGAWWATVHGVTKSQTQLSNFTFFMAVSQRYTHNQNKCKSHALWNRHSIGGKMLLLLLLLSHFSRVRLCATP